MQVNMIRLALFCVTLVPVWAAAQPTVPSFAPTTTSYPTPTDRICDDDKVLRFRTSPTQTEPCIWLADRPEEQTKFCQTGMEAYNLCEETCLKCRDPCEDGPESFLVNGTVRDCMWLSLRFTVQQKVCHSKHTAYFACPETCDVCDRFSPNPTATPTMIVATASPTTTTPVGPTPTIGCDDSSTARFFVAETNKVERCIWLASRPDFQATYCAEGHPSGAGVICEETCGSCSDSCSDYGLSFLINGVLRDCTWLGLRPEVIEMICHPGTSANFICPETCNACDSDDNVITPSRAPIPEFCDDDKLGNFFVAESLKYERCVWLEARADAQVTYCQQNHPSGAFDLCEETCGKCSDSCEDSDSKYMIDGEIRDCTWLSLRLAEQEAQCISGKDAYELCGETCDVCDGMTPIPTLPPTLSPNQSAAPAPTPTPTHSPGICDDSKSGTFFVAETNKFEPCVWLDARVDEHIVYCQIDHPSGAFNLCAETCKKCADNCTDSDSKFLIGDKIRTCLWLKLRPDKQPVQCMPGTDAYVLCGETCDVCDKTIAI